MHMQARAPARLIVDKEERHLAAKVVPLEAYRAALAGLWLCGERRIVNIRVPPIALVAELNLS